MLCLASGRQPPLDCKPPAPLDSDSHGWGLAPHPLTFPALSAAPFCISWAVLKGHGGSHLRGSPGFSAKCLRPEQLHDI